MSSLLLFIMISSWSNAAMSSRCSIVHRLLHIKWMELESRALSMAITNVSSNYDEIRLKSHLFLGSTWHFCPIFHLWRKRVEFSLAISFSQMVTKVKWTEPEKGTFYFFTYPPPEWRHQFHFYTADFQKGNDYFSKNKTSSTIERRERHKRCRLWSTKKKKSFSSCFPSPLIYSSFHLSFPSLKIRKVRN